jgi:hypothetical protein
MTMTRDRRVEADALTSGSAPGRVTMRQSRARLSDARVWGGLALLAVSALVGAVLLGRGEDTVVVLQATRDLSVGSAPQDLEPVAIPSSLATGYLTAADEVTGVLRWPVTAGELVPRSALAPANPRPERGVTVAVDPAHAPAGLMAGDRVDVWSTASDPGALAGEVRPVLVLASARVLTVATEAGGFAGSWGVELAVPEESVADVVAAGRGGVLDLVTVPGSSQGVGG